MSSSNIPEDKRPLSYYSPPKELVTGKPDKVGRKECLVPGRSLQGKRRLGDGDVHTHAHMHDAS